MDLWRDLPSHLSPVFFKIGALEVRWYGLCYFFAIFLSFLLCSWRIRRKEIALKQNHLEDYYFWVILGIVIGARLAYVIFYQWSYYAAQPLEIFLPLRFEKGSIEFTGISGLSFHGGWAGSILATVLFCRKHKLKAWEFLDFIVPSVPAGYFFGRLGNFLNGELYGRVTASKWAMIFPADPLQLPRHPSQLYEAFGEGIVIFLILWPLRNKKFFPGWIFCAYAFLYGAIRFLIEYTRAPDAQLGLLVLRLTMGQWLCVGMIAISIIFSVILHNRKNYEQSTKHKEQ